MGFLSALFGPSRDEVWAQLCTQIQGELVDDGWRASKVQARVKDWILTLDTYTQSSGKSSTDYTRLRAPFVNRDRFQFTIYRTGLMTPLAKFFGLQDVEIGDPLFDEAFVVQSNNEAKIRAMLANSRIRELLHAQPTIGQFTIKDDEGWFATSGYPNGVDVLYFEVVSVVKDIAVLESLYALFAEVLNHLCHLDSAYHEDIDLHLLALRAPGGQIRADQVVLWEGDPPRAAAAQSLGALRARKAVPYLITALEDRYQPLRLNAAWALGEIGDPAASSALIPLLGDELPQVSHYSGSALRQLGHGQFVDALAAMLQGGGHCQETLRRYEGPPLTEALNRLLHGSDSFRVTQSAQALARFGAVESLPLLRERLRALRHSAAPSHVEGITDAIRRLEMQKKLPRPAATPAANAQELPLPASDA